MKLKLLAKRCGFNKIMLKKPNIIIETKLKNSTFNLLKNVLSSTIQNKLHYEQGSHFSKIIIRGLGVTEIQNQLDQLISWFGLFVKEIQNFDKESNSKKV